MVALDKQFFHHHGTKPQGRGRWRDESWKAGKTPGRRTADILSARRPRDTSISSNTSCANEIIYCGYRLDPESQLYYVRNRTYNPVLGRWIQRDPIGYNGGINLYGYVESGPASYNDPAGLAADTPLWKRNLQKCLELLRKIRSLRKDIDRQRRNLRNNPLGLPESCPGDDTKPSLSIRGHRQILKNYENSLHNNVNKYNSRGCGGNEGVPKGQPIIDVTPKPVPLGLPEGDPGAVIAGDTAAATGAEGGSAVATGAEVTTAATGAAEGFEIGDLLWGLVIFAF